MSYLGIPPFGQTVRSVTNITATASQTDFNIVGGYQQGYVDVFLNGSLLVPTTDYTATDGLTVVLTSAAALNDEFQALSYQPISLIDCYTETQVDTLLALKADLAGAQTFSGLQTFSGSSSAAAIKVPNIKEVATISATAATGTINYDITTQSVLYYTTDASANWTLNVRGSSGTSLDTLMSTGETMTAVFMVTQGSTAYYNSDFQIDGNAVTPKWQGGSAPTAGNINGIDVYTYAIVKTGSATFTVFASVVAFA